MPSKKIGVILSVAKNPESNRRNYNAYIVCSLLALILSGGAYGEREIHPAGSRAQKTLQVSANGRYFQTADGRPWFWLGDTAWSLLTDYTPLEEDGYLAVRAKMGFTIVQTVAAWDGGTGTTHGLNPNANTAGIQPWARQDPLKPNEAYWKNVDRVVAEAAKDGLYVGLLPSWGSFVVNSKMITMANAEAYGRWLGQRYKNAPNLIWIEGGDRDVSWSRGTDGKFAEPVMVWRAMARGLKEGDGGAHLTMLHPGGILRDNQHEKWLAADMIQTWAWYKDIPREIAIDYNLKPTKPVILAEGAYEDAPEPSPDPRTPYPTGPITPLIVRKQAYWTYLSGGFFTYGHTDMWRKNPTWKASLHSEGARDMQVLHQIFKTVPWWKLRPDQALFGAGRGSGTTMNAAAISSQRNWAMVYLSSPVTVQLHLDRLKGHRWSAVWTDPRTGHRTRKTEYSAAGVKSFTTPAGWPDALLLLRSEH